MWPALAAAGASLIGGMMANDANQDISQANNAFNAAQADKNRTFQSQEAAVARNFNRTEAELNRNFQEEMSSSAYQRAALDLKKAGLNPILSLMKGGASQPSGGMASASAPSGSTAASAGNPTMKDVLSPAVTSAMGMAQGMEQVENMKAHNSLLKAQEGKVVAETITELNRPENVMADTAHKNTSAANLAMNTHLQEIQFQKVGHEMKLIAAQANTEHQRTVLTEAQTRLTNLQSGLTSGQIKLNAGLIELNELERMIKDANVVGAAEEAKFQRVWGQLRRILAIPIPGK